LYFYDYSILSITSWDNISETSGIRRIMKLSEFTSILDRLITDEEKDLELPVMSAKVEVVLSRHPEIVLHTWKYEKKVENE
jgi:hypothetical protein